jgi:hypothetical protein
MAAGADSAKRRSDSETGYARPRLRETSGDFKTPARRQPLLSDRPSHDPPRLDIPARTRRQGGSAAEAEDPRFATSATARGELDTGPFVLLAAHCRNLGSASRCSGGQQGRCRRVSICLRAREGKCGRFLLAAGQRPAGSGARAELDRRQLLHLLLCQLDPYLVAHARGACDRDRHLLAPP